MTTVDQYLNQMQFAYLAGRGSDAKVFMLNTLHKHLEKHRAHARILFADFFHSDFNTVHPHLLAESLVSDYPTN